MADSKWLRIAGIAVIVGIAGFVGVQIGGNQDAGAAEAKAESAFAKETIDLGVVVSDIEKSLKFYTEAVGFKKMGSFKVPSDMGKNSGLTDGSPLTIHVLKLGTGSGATTLKLMQVGEKKRTKSDETYIHSTYGYSYITIFVNDTTSSVARLKKHGVKVMAKGPVALPKSLREGYYLTVFKDPDGNFVEFVGPKK